MFHCKGVAALRTEVSTYDWFKRKDRPPADSDSLGPYQFPPANPLKTVDITIPLCRRLITALAGDSHIWERWQDVGSVTLDLFSYLWSGIVTGAGSETGIGDIIDEEFRIYRYHQRLIDGKPHFGWQRIMIRSLTQQAIRADIGYWLSYVALRPDDNPQLVSYPYYTKLASAGDRTFFRHCDINIERFLTDGNGGEIIQGSVSLDVDTAEGGFTEIVPGFHRCIADWWEDVIKRAGAGQVKNLKNPGKVKNVSNLYIEEDAGKFGPFTKVLCRQGWYFENQSIRELFPKTCDQTPLLQDPRPVLKISDRTFERIQSANIGKKVKCSACSDKVFNTFT